jgi:solute carrier family 25 (mitochondrial dicarboxylate transporter), member 10
MASGARGLFDGISGTWMRQMSYSVCRFWAYDESKKFLGAGTSRFLSSALWMELTDVHALGANAPPWKLAAAGSMGK